MDVLEGRWPTVLTLSSPDDLERVVISEDLTDRPDGKLKEGSLNAPVGEAADVSPFPRAAIGGRGAVGILARYFFKRFALTQLLDGFVQCFQRLGFSAMFAVADLNLLPFHTSGLPESILMLTIVIEHLLPADVSACPCLRLQVLHGHGLFGHVVIVLVQRRAKFLQFLLQFNLRVDAILPLQPLRFVGEQPLKLFVKPFHLFFVEGGTHRFHQQLPLHLLIQVPPDQRCDQFPVLRGRRLVSELFQLGFVRGQYIGGKDGGAVDRGNDVRSLDVFGFRLCRFRNVQGCRDIRRFRKFRVGCSLFFACSQPRGGLFERRIVGHGGVFPRGVCRRRSEIRRPGRPAADQKCCENQKAV